MSSTRIFQKEFKKSPAIQRKSQPADAFINKIPPQLIKYLITNFLNDKDVMSLSCSTFHMHTTLKDNLKKHALKQLLQAMIDDDRPKVISILHAKPELLILEPADVGIKKIESKKTWQQFRTEKVFIMAQKLKRLEMMKILLPFFKNMSPIKKTNDIKEDTKQSTEILQIKNMNDLLLKLITTITSDNSIKINKSDHALPLDMNKDTELALETFRKRLLPDEAVAIDDYFDIEQFLIAAYKAYENHLSSCEHPTIYFNNWPQRDVYAIFVIGFLQSLVSPEYGKIICEGLFNVAAENKKISDRSSTLTLINNRSFYRASRNANSGLGFNFLCSLYNGIPIKEAWPLPTPVPGVREFLPPVLLLEKLSQIKTAEFRKLMQQMHYQIERIPNDKPYQCVIF